MANLKTITEIDYLKKEIKISENMLNRLEKAVKIFIYRLSLKALKLGLLFCLILFQTDPGKKIPVEKQPPKE